MTHKPLFCLFVLDSAGPLNVQGQAPLWLVLAPPPLSLLLLLALFQWTLEARPDVGVFLANWRRVRATLAGPER